MGAGLGEFAGKVWRVGLMGESSKYENIIALLSALESILLREGYEVARGSGVEAVTAAYAVA